MFFYKNIIHRIKQFKNKYRLYNTYKDMSATDTNIYTERFPLKKYTSQESIHMIHTMTNSLINSQYLAVMLETIQRRQYTWSSFLEASLPETLIKQIIGKNGLHLKQFTTKYGVDLIWHDRASNRFFVWGPKSALISTLYALKHHIKRFQVKYATDLDADQSLECSLQNIVIVKESETFIREREDELLMEQPPQKKFKYE
jgi:hypothetical protein